MAKVILYTQPDGRVCVCRPCVSRDDPLGFTMEDALTRALANDVPETALNVKVIDNTALPINRSFRAAWRQQGEEVRIEISKARELRLAQLRTERDAKLAATDGLMARATERGNAAEWLKLAAHRQALRGMPAEITAVLAAAITPADLMAVRPAVLDEEP